MNNESCVYCHPTNEILLWQNPLCRAIFIADSPFPGWCRVVWHEHIAELSDLRDDQRNSIMTVVAQVEAQLRQLLTPAKINIASRSLINSIKFSGTVLAVGERSAWLQTGSGKCESSR